MWGHLLFVVLLWSSKEFECRCRQWSAAAPSWPQARSCTLNNIRLDDYAGVYNYHLVDQCNWDNAADRH